MVRNKDKLTHPPTPLFPASTSFLHLNLPLLPLPTPGALFPPRTSVPLRQRLRGSVGPPELPGTGWNLPCPTQGRPALSSQSLLRPPCCPWPLQPPLPRVGLGAAPASSDREEVVTFNHREMYLWPPLPLTSAPAGPGVDTVFPGLMHKGKGAPAVGSHFAVMVLVHLEGATGEPPQVQVGAIAGDELPLGADGGHCW